MTRKIVAVLTVVSSCAIAACSGGEDRLGGDDTSRDKASIADGSVDDWGLEVDESTGDIVVTGYDNPDRTPVAQVRIRIDELAQLDFDESSSITVDITVTTFVEVSAEQQERYVNALLAKLKAAMELDIGSSQSSLTSTSTGAGVGAQAFALSSCTYGIAELVLGAMVAVTLTAPIAVLAGGNATFGDVPISEAFADAYRSYGRLWQRGWSRFESCWE